MEINQYKNLLDQVNTLSTHYKKINDLTGENFNIFRILKLESSEVRLHSAFLAELLNPKGNHGQKDIFLKLFLNTFCFKGNIINSENCNVKTEKHTVLINKTFTEGGYIDILITDGKSGNQIVIENKIYAGDQTNQMLRYYNYAPKADLIYLTLDGKEPHEKSYDNLKSGEHFKCYSYKTNILEWLEQCRKEVAIIPIVRESLTQYINLIKYLTNQTINDSMQTELNALIKSNLEASFAVFNNLDNALDELLINFIGDLKILCNGLGLNFENHINFDTRYNGFRIWKDEWKYVNIEFQFWNGDKDMVYGFASKENPIKNSLPIDLKNTLITLSNTTLKPNDWWPLYYKVEEPYNDWSKFQAWEAVVNGTMKKVIKEKVEFLLNITEGMDL